MKNEYTYEEVLSFTRPDEKLKSFHFIVEDILRSILKEKNPEPAYYDKMGFLDQYEAERLQ